MNALGQEPCIICPGSLVPNTVLGTGLIFIPTKWKSINNYNMRTAHKVPKQSRWTTWTPCYVLPCLCCSSQKSMSVWLGPTLLNTFSILWVKAPLGKRDIKQAILSLKLSSNCSHQKPTQKINFLVGFYTEHVLKPKDRTVRYLGKSFSCLTTLGEWKISHIICIYSYSYWKTKNKTGSLSP